MLFESKDKMSLEDIHKMTIVHFHGHDYNINILLLAAPVMLFFVFLEMWYSHRKNLGLYSKAGLLGSVGVGIGYLIVTFLTQGFTFFIVWAAYYYLAPFGIPTSTWYWKLISFVGCIVFYDFCRYWAHRIAHEQRFWWASHITHHSSDHYNLTVSFRLCWVDQIKLIFFVPVVMVGFDPVIFFIVHQIGVLYQFWQHSDVIPPLPKWFEEVMVTPTNHKVHHGKNHEYIDVNYGSMFIFWDKLFGTYRKPGERPEWGVKQPINSNNPVYLVFHEYVDIFRDVWHAKTFKDKYKAMFGRPGEYEGVDKF